MGRVVTALSIHPTRHTGERLSRACSWQHRSTAIRCNSWKAEEESYSWPKEVRLSAPAESTFFPASGGALGTLISDHPALKGFPSEGFCDLQFFNLLEGAYAYPLDEWPKEMVPIVGGIRTTTGFLSKTKNLSRVGYVFEAKVGKGKLLVSTLRIRDNFDEAYPEAISLFDHLLRYATSQGFEPQFEISPEQLRRFQVQ